MTTPRHRVSVAAAQMRGIAADVSDASVWSMSVEETGATLLELTRLEAQVHELKARVAAHADDLHVGQDVGASSAASWWAHQTRTTRAAAHGTVRLGHDLETHPLTRDALASGDLLAEQARTIVRWVDQLPDTLDADTVEEAERHLLEQAAHHDAKALNRLGKRLFEVVAPEEADAREAALLEREEAAAIRACHLRMHDDGEGRTHGTFTIPTFHGAALAKMLQAIATPKHQAAMNGPGAARRTTPEAMGQALCELIERYPASKLPLTGGVNATVVVTVDVDVLLGRLEQAGILDTGEAISPGMARRLACEAGIIPAVLDGASQPLDLGRRRRLFTDHQRTAIQLRDRGCRAEGCDRTAGLHAHHRTRWTDGGPTDLDNAVSLCHWHHARAHDTHYVTTYHANGEVAFHRRT
ncbi:MAG: DUF222 domain-containing protein [Nocardioides sp.]